MKSAILIVSHAHPKLSKGGGETAAYALYVALKRVQPDADIRFLAVADTLVAPGEIAQFCEGEYLLGRCISCDFMLRNSDISKLRESIASFLTEFRPYYVNFHHYYNIGVDVISLFRLRLPKSFFVLTLHEYLAICPNNGQMFNRSGFRCIEADIHRCSQCMPERSASQLHSRRLLLSSVVHFFDKCVSPSEFLRDVYINWGVSGEQIRVMENPLLISGDRRDQDIALASAPIKFGYFGQINPYKGVELLLDAALILVQKRVETGFKLEINGANLERQSVAFKDRFLGKLERLVEAGYVVWNGPYTQAQLLSRMNQIDWVVVPSVWWENSPVVIQESWTAGRPVLCSAFGGMAEKVRHNIDGLHASESTPECWARLLLMCAGNLELYTRLRLGIRFPRSADEIAREYLSLQGEQG